MVDAACSDIGDADGTCVVTRSGTVTQASVTCQSTNTLRKGQLFTAMGGPGAVNASTVRGSVVGGTGEYAGAIGTFIAQGRRTAKVTFKLFLPK